MNKKKSLSYVRLFWATFSISAFTLGGGYVMLPLMKKKFVEEHAWIKEDEMFDIIAIAQATPGAMAINASILIGYRLAGVWGAATAIFATVLPPLIVISSLSYSYVAFRENEYVTSALKGMSIGVAAVIAEAVFQMNRSILKKKSTFTIVLLLASFLAGFLFKLDLKWILLFCGMFGAGKILLQRQKK